MRTFEPGDLVCMLAVSHEDFTYNDAYQPLFLVVRDGHEPESCVVTQLDEPDAAEFTLEKDRLKHAVWSFVGPVACDVG